MSETHTLDFSVTFHLYFYTPSSGDSSDLTSLSSMANSDAAASSWAAFFSASLEAFATSRRRRSLSAIVSWAILIEGECEGGLVVILEQTSMILRSSGVRILCNMPSYTVVREEESSMIQSKNERWTTNSYAFLLPLRLCFLQQPPQIVRKGLAIHHHIFIVVRS